MDKIYVCSKYCFTGQANQNPFLHLNPAQIPKKIINLNIFTGPLVNPPIFLICLLLTTGNIHERIVKMFRVHLIIQLRENDYLIKRWSVHPPSPRSI